MAGQQSGGLLRIGILGPVVATRRQHNNGYGAGSANTRQHLETIQSRHHDIEDGNVVSAVHSGIRAASTVMSAGDDEPVALQVVTHHFEQFAIVIDEQHGGFWAGLWRTHDLAY